MFPRQTYHLSFDYFYDVKSDDLMMNKLINFNKTFDVIKLNEVQNCKARKIVRTNLVL